MLYLRNASFKLIFLSTISVFIGNVSPLDAQSLLITPTPALPSLNQTNVIDANTCVQQLDDYIEASNVVAQTSAMVGIPAEIIGALDPSGVTEAAAVSIQLVGVIAENVIWLTESDLQANNAPECDTTFAGTVEVTNGGINVTGNSIFQNGLGVVGNQEVGGSLSIAGVSTTNGITNNGEMVTDTLHTNGDAMIGGSIAVAGDYFTNDGDITTTNGAVRAGSVEINPDGSGRISGLSNAVLSSTSTDAVTGQQLQATNDLIMSLGTRQSSNLQRLLRRGDKAYQGVAMGFASNAAPMHLANGESGIAAGAGMFEGEWATAVRFQSVTQSGVGLGANVGLAKDSLGAGVGASIKF